MGKISGDYSGSVGENKMIYDCFMFFEELDILDMRLNILDKVVDKFVLVEGTRTFRGTPKKLLC